MTHTSHGTDNISLKVISYLATDTECPGSCPSSSLKSLKFLFLQLPAATFLLGLVWLLLFCSHWEFEGGREDASGSSAECPRHYHLLLVDNWEGKTDPIPGRPYFLRWVLRHFCVMSMLKESTSYFILLFFLIIAWPLSRTCFDFTPCSRSEFYFELWHCY